MKLRALVLRSLQYRWRQHLGVLLGAAVGSAALIGALVVGDSVRGSLHEQALQRMGWVDAALASPDGFFTERLAGSIQSATGSVTIQRTAPALKLPATAARPDGSARANHVFILGVRSNFWPEAMAGTFASMPRQSVILNEGLAAQLNAKPGDGLVFRVHKPSALSRDVPITPQSDASVALRLTVHKIVGAAEMGSFDLQSRQGPPLNAFVHLDDLAGPAGLKGKANLVLAAEINGSSDQTDTHRLNQFLASKMRLQDYDAEVRPVTNSTAVEVRSDRIFLHPALMEKATAAGAFGEAIVIQPLLTYLVNSIRNGERLVPYSMVTAAGPPWTPTALKDDEIIVNQWLADRLQMKPGDSIELAFFLPESGSALVERTNRFQVHSVVPIEGTHGDRTLMPEFPGLAKAESTHDWDAGFPLVHKIGDEDEAYWKTYRGTPKAFVTWKAGTSMWENRFGKATAIRLSPSSQPFEGLASHVATNLLARLDPAAVGLSFQPVRASALTASSQSQDFGGLFIGFSFFLIIAALILMALLFQFGLEQRATEVGTLLALGFTPRQVRKLLLWEGGMIALVGGAIGLACGLGYALAMLRGLTTIWRDAIGASALHFFVTPLSLGVGLISSFVVCAVTIWIVLRQQARRPARALLAEGGLESNEPRPRPGGRWAGGSALAGIAGGAGMVGWALLAGENASPGIFFGAGSLLLLGGLALSAVFLRRLERVDRKRTLSLTSLGLRGATRRRRRSLASMALLASGSFLIVAVGANRLDSGKDASKRSAGTGGFALIGESTLPVIRDLNTAAGREFYGLKEQELAGVSFVPFRVRDGDEASCLNLNRAQQPRLLGVNPAALSERRAFTFSRVLKGLPSQEPWILLRAQSEDVIPAIGDAASIQWALGRKLGDVLDYTDERGRAFKVRLVGAVANSVLQGNLVIDEAEFVRRFPSEGGHRMFLIDVPSNMPLTNVTAALSRGLQDVGLELTPATQRLAAFNAVQNTYLNTFQVLGGLGLLLGSVGLGVVVLRNVLERRAEFGLMLAVGYRRRLLQWLVLSEHGGLLTLGLAIGMSAALVAVLPVLLVPGAQIHTVALVATVGGVLSSGLLWTWLATRLALRGELLEALRSE